MLTSNRFAVSWLYQERDRMVRRHLYNYTAEPCIEAARIISGNPYASEIEVREVDTGKEVSWESAQVGEVLCKNEVMVQ